MLGRKEKKKQSQEKLSFVSHQIKIFSYPESLAHKWRPKSPEPKQENKTIGNQEKFICFEWLMAIYENDNLWA